MIVHFHNSDRQQRAAHPLLSLHASVTASEYLSIEKTISSSFLPLSSIPHPLTPCRRDDLTIPLKMEDDMIRIEDHPLHWRATLLGEDFWKDAEEYNQRTSNDIDHGENLILFSASTIY